MGPVIPQCHLKHYDLKDQIYQFESVFLCLTLFSHIRLQHSVGQLSSRLLNDLAYFLKLFLCFCCFVLRVSVLSANEKQIERCQMMRHCDRECTLWQQQKVYTQQRKFAGVFLFIVCPQSVFIPQIIYL